MKWLALLIFGGIGAGVLVGGILWGFRRISLFSEGRRTTGEVVSQEVHTEEDEEILLDPEDPSRYIVNINPLLLEYARKKAPR